MPVRQRTVELVQSWRIYPLVSALLLAPCFWQPRLQAGDLSSHIYNAWLAQLIESGRAQGLTIVHQTTNILFDLMLNGLFRLAGPEMAQRIAVSTAVLVFAWGAFAFMKTVSGRKPWHLMPCIAMLAYGWVFHMGFFNFYLSLGFCCWAMAAAWELKRRNILAAIPLLLLAYVAHALPVLWTVGLLAYAGLANRLAPVHRAALTSACVAGLVALHAAIARIMYVRWSPIQVTLSSGLDQVWIFDAKYYVVLIGLLIVWALLFLGLLRLQGPRQVVTSLPFHLCILSAAAVLILPDTVLIPGFVNALGYIAERMSLGVAICVCAMLATARPRKLERWALVAVSMVFFSFIYTDERALNRFENRMEDVISALSPGQRVVSGVQDADSRFDSVRHMIDRVCIERCFSYGNYEASTAQFRIRAKRRNDYVASDYRESCALQFGGYVVKDRDLPIYQVEADPQGNLFVRALNPGTKTTSKPSRILEPLLPAALTGSKATRPDGQEPPALPSGSKPRDRHTSTSRAG
jgi:hypothetical protein